MQRLREVVRAHGLRHCNSGSNLRTGIIYELTFSRPCSKGLSPSFSLDRKTYAQSSRMKVDRSINKNAGTWGEKYNRCLFLGRGGGS